MAAFVLLVVGLIAALALCKPAGQVPPHQPPATVVTR